MTLVFRYMVTTPPGRPTTLTLSTDDLGEVVSLELCPASAVALASDLLLEARVNLGRPLTPNPTGIPPS